MDSSSLQALKDLEIEMLKEKLEFSKKQLQDRDLELEHYRSLVATLQTLVTVRSTPSGSPVGVPQRKLVTKSRSAPLSNDKNEGWLMDDGNESSKGPQKIKKQVSFHNDVEIRYFGEQKFYNDVMHSVSHQMVTVGIANV
jgi:hypothetical protein